MYVFDSLYYDINFNLIQLKCTRVQLIILTFLRNKLFVITALDYFAVFKHHNRVAVSYCGESVRDNKYRSALHQFIHTLLDKLFRAGID